MAVSHRHPVRLLAPNREPHAASAVVAGSSAAPNQQLITHLRDGILTSGPCANMRILNVAKVQLEAIAITDFQARTIGADMQGRLPRSGASLEVAVEGCAIV